MLSSSKEYLQALREGKYLLFLEWPQFIAEHYKESNKPQDGDDTIQLLIFEWLNNGYTESDVQKIALLYAVQDLPTKPIKGDISYALTAISIAAFQCMLFQSIQLEDKFLSSKPMNKQQVNEFIYEISSHIDKPTYESLLLKQQVIFYSWVEGMPSKDVKQADQQISPLTDLRYLAEDYILQLESNKLNNDLLKFSRLSVIKRLARYLNDVFELTPEVRQNIELYVNKIRELQPAPFEMEFIVLLSPPSLMDNTWQLITGLGMSFFKWIQPPAQAEPLEPILEKGNKPEPLRNNAK